MLAEQSIIHEEGRRITSFNHTRRPIERNQYQHHWSITKIQWKEYNYSNCEQVYKDDSTQGNNNKHIIGGDCKDLLGWNMEII